MRFGVEMIALLHPQRELPAFFHHELLPMYQAQQLGDDVPTDASNRFGGPCGMKASLATSAGNSIRR
jgi:hypothetical protein